MSLQGAKCTVLHIQDEASSLTYLVDIGAEVSILIVHFPHLHHMTALELVLDKPCTLLILH